MMKTTALALATQLLPVSVWGALLVDYNATRGDAVSEMGPILTLEKDDDVRVDSNIPDLYIKKDTDWEGTPSAHIHRKKGYTRAEYHALKDKISLGQPYYLGYRLAVDSTPESLVVFQWKEYTNTEQPSGANVPLSLSFNTAGNLVLKANEPGATTSLILWEKDIGSRHAVDIAMRIVPGADGDGSVDLWYNGRKATLVDGDGSHVGTWMGTTMPGDTSPKWGAYRGEESEIDTWIYEVQVGQDEADLNPRFFTT